jgi:hypothetical protein
MRHNILFSTSKEDHSYATGEIYQRVIAIVNRMTDNTMARWMTAKGQKDKQRSSRIYKDTFPPSPLKLVVTVLKWKKTIRLVCQTTLARLLYLTENVGVQIQFGKKVSLLLLNVREYQRAIQKWQSREANNLGYTTRNKTAKTQHNVCWTPLCTHTHTHNYRK